MSDSTKAAVPVTSFFPSGYDNDQSFDLDFRLLSEFLFDEPQLGVSGMDFSIESIVKGVVSSLPEEKDKNEILEEEHSISSTRRRSTKGSGTKSASIPEKDQEGTDEDVDLDLDEGEELSPNVDETKPKSALDRRRERNKVLARKTRLRKKIFLESLQKRVTQLTEENQVLKDIAQKHLSPDTYKSLLYDFVETPNNLTYSDNVNSVLEKSDFRLMCALQVEFAIL